MKKVLEEPKRHCRGHGEYIYTGHIRQDMRTFYRNEKFDHEFWWEIANFFIQKPLFYGCPKCALAYSYLPKSWISL